MKQDVYPKKQQEELNNHFHNFYKKIVTDSICDTTTNHDFNSIIKYNSDESHF